MAAVVYYVKREYSDDSEGATDVSDTNDDTGDDIVLHQLQSLRQQDLLSIFEVLMQAVPALRETVRLLLVERKRMDSMISERVHDMGLYSSLAYYQKEIPVFLDECESLFIEKTDENDEDEDEDEDEDDDWGYGYEDDEEEGKEWDFAAGLERLHRFGQGLLKLVTPEQYISGTVGLMVTVIELRKWTERYVDEYGGSELDEGCGEFEVFLQEALKQVKRYQESNPDARIFLQELAEWIVGQCKQLDDLLEWTAYPDMNLFKRNAAFP
jgi:hypothetical protein